MVEVVGITLLVEVFLGVLAAWERIGSRAPISNERFVLKPRRA